jgi:hypothetical protein
MDQRRRQLILNTLFGTGWVGLRALATGLPLSMFLDPHNAKADPSAACKTSQYLVLLTSGGGDPLNANVPGTYENAGVYHPSDPTMAPMSMTIGGQTVKAATPWATLPTNILSRTCFFHHGTYTNSHGDAAKVNKLMGAIMRQEMLCSLIAANTGPCLQTVQNQPVVMNNNLISYAGAVQPILNPTNLQAVLVSPTGVLANLRTIRDSNVDALNMLFKKTGNTAQSQMLDKYALSQTQARNLNEMLLTDLGSVKGSSLPDYNTAMSVLFAMNVSPVAVATYGFGGDNHHDVGLAGETTQTVASVAAISDLITKLTKYSLQDKVTIAFQNVFGRTMSLLSRAQGNADGRDHNANHHCTVIIGSGIKSSLIGGIEPTADGKNFRATGIDSVSGKSNDAGDVPYENTLGAVGKTIGAAVGVSQTVLDTQITLGKTIPAALA